MKTFMLDAVFALAGCSGAAPVFTLAAQQACAPTGLGQITISLARCAPAKSDDTAATAATSIFNIYVQPEDTVTGQAAKHQLLRHDMNFEPLGLNKTIKAGKSETAVPGQAADQSRKRPRLDAGKYHYENPAAPGGCQAGENKITITGFSGDFCAPSCSSTKECPTDRPPGTTAVGQCVLTSAGSQKPDGCALVCEDAGSDVCPSSASCKKDKVGTAFCTYDTPTPPPAPPPAPPPTPAPPPFNPRINQTGFCGVNFGGIVPDADAEIDHCIVTGSVSAVIIIGAQRPFPNA